MSLGKIYTLSEVAEHLRMTPRSVAKIARRYGLCMAAGRRLTFTETDINEIKQRLRVQPVERHAKPAKPGPSDYQLRKSLERLLAKK